MPQQEFGFGQVDGCVHVQPEGAREVDRVERLVRILSHRCEKIGNLLRVWAEGAAASDRQPPDDRAFHEFDQEQVRGRRNRQKHEIRPRRGKPR